MLLLIILMEIPCVSVLYTGNIIHIHMHANTDVYCIYTAGCQALVGCLPYFIRNHALLFAFRVLYGTMLIYHTDDSILIDTSCSTQPICRNRYGDNGIFWGGLYSNKHTIGSHIPFTTCADKGI